MKVNIQFRQTPSNMYSQAHRFTNFMNKSPALLFRVLAAATLLSGLTACTRSTRISTRGAGHDISAEIEGNHSIDSQTNRAVIASEFGRITVEPARVQFGGGPWTRIPEGVPMMAGIFKHKRWVTAGGVSVKETSE